MSVPCTNFCTCLDFSELILPRMAHLAFASPPRISSRDIICWSLRVGSRFGDGCIDQGCASGGTALDPRRAETPRAPCRRGA